MGKNEDDQFLSTTNIPNSSETTDSNDGVSNGRLRSIGRHFGFRCVLLLLIGVAVFLSAAFWLLPFFNGSRDLEPQFHGAYVVASFRLEKPVSLLNANTAKLQYDIYVEIGLPDFLVAVISLEPLAGSNWTNVIFGIWPYPKSSSISSTSLSIIRAYFMGFVTGQSTLHLTTSLFGNTSFFQSLRFPGGITIIPQQNVFLLQPVNVLFNFSLNFPIYKVQEKLVELKAQMKSGLHLNSYENLYVNLTNLKGSTVDPPTVVETSVVLAVGNRPPSIPRLRQLAQTIRNSSHGNLGLDHTVFGRVKQIQLSSFLKHSLNSGTNGPTPAPQPQPQAEHPHHHRHHHRHHPDVDLAPAHAPARHTHKSSAPCGSHFIPNHKHRSHDHVVPVAAPTEAEQNAPSPTPDANIPAPSQVDNSHAPAPHLHTPPRQLVLTHARPPSQSGTAVIPGIHPISPSPFSSSVTNKPYAVRLILVLLICICLHICDN